MRHRCWEETPASIIFGASACACRSDAPYTIPYFWFSFLFLSALCFTLFQKPFGFARAEGRKVLYRLIVQALWRGRTPNENSEICKTGSNQERGGNSLADHNWYTAEGLQEIC
jgi:hypothetical protein